MRSLSLFIPGALVNPQGSQRGGTWHKRARLAKSIRERVSMYILKAAGRRMPWPAATPKRVTFTAYVWNPYDSDNLQMALKNHRDALKAMNLINDDRESAGHEFVYRQVVSRGKDAKRGVEVEVTLR